MLDIALAKLLSASLVLKTNEYFGRKMARLQEDFWKSMGLESIKGVAMLHNKIKDVLGLL